MQAVAAGNWTIPPSNTVAPVVSGTAAVGQTLSTTDGTWSGNPAPTTFTYQWQLGTTDITGATSSTYVIQAGDVGNTLRCVVTATSTSGSTSANSNNSGVVAPPTQLWGWGIGSTGALGLGNTTNYSSPKQVGALTNWDTITSSFSSTVALKTDGTLWSWGANGAGQLGLGNTTSYSSPKQVGALTNWSKVRAASNANTGDGMVIALKTDGTLWTWGKGNYGRLGLGNTTSYSSPKQVGSETDWAEITTGNPGFCLAIKTSGTLWSWGYNFSGALGLGNTTDRSSPVQVGALTNWQKVSAMGNAVLAVKTDGTLWAWGRNTYGQLGLGNTTVYSSPKQVGSLTDWAEVAITSSTFSCAIKTDGTLWAWGINNVGQLGQGNTTNQSSPVQVGGSSNWSKLGPTNSTLLAITTSGTLWGCGANGQGQLAQGDTTNRSSLIQIGALTTWDKLNVGSGSANHVMATKTP